ncbi:hypothetical protein GCM10007171_29660 [Dickeya fangzhongdai]|nr:hypothetical protein GCM10007171_29660 [Dickeya fangzhongdai]
MCGIPALSRAAGALTVQIRIRDSPGYRLQLERKRASRPHGFTAPEHHQTNLGMITPNASRQADG